MDRKQIIFLGNKGEELFREVKPDVKVGKIQGLFESFGYPWKEHDPFASEYKLWVENYPGFDAHANALLAAREKAIKEEDDKKITDIRQELSKMGIIIYDEDGKQYVRTAKGDDQL